MNLIESMLKPVNQQFDPIARVTVPQPYRPPQYQQSDMQPQNIPQPRQQTPKERLVSLNPAYSSMNLSPAQIAAHLAFEEQNNQREQEKIQGKLYVENMQNAKKQRLQMMANQMEKEFSQKQAREEQYAQELSVLEQKYQVQTPVRFS
jgi:hypothetical protein